MKKIVIVGSLNMDVVIETPQMPKVGETIAGHSITLNSGGKGANQAYTIGKLGGDVSMIGAVGADAHGEDLRNNLIEVGVDICGVEILENTFSGQAFITVDDQGDNSIIVIAGANGQVTKELIDRHMDLLEASDIVIMQMEIPLDVIAYVKEVSVHKGKLTIIHPAPARSDLQDGFWQGGD